MMAGKRGILPAALFGRRRFRHCVRHGADGRHLVWRQRHERRAAQYILLAGRCSFRARYPFCEPTFSALCMEQPDKTRHQYGCADQPGNPAVPGAQPLSNDHSRHADLFRRRSDAHIPAFDRPLSRFSAAGSRARGGPASRRLAIFACETIAREWRRGNGVGTGTVAGRQDRACERRTGTCRWHAR